MDLMPINVLADSKAAPSSPHAAPAKQSFADVLSTHPQPPDRRPAPPTKVVQAQSRVNNKESDRKAKSADARKSEQSNRDLEPQASANPATVPPIPAPTTDRILSLDSLVASFSGIDPSATKASKTNATVPPAAPGPLTLATGAEAADQKAKTAVAKSSSRTDSSTSSAAAHAARTSHVNLATDDDIAPADSENTDATPKPANHPSATESKAQAGEAKVLTSFPASPAVPNVAPAPKSSELGHVQTSASEKESPANASNRAQDAASGQPMSALAAAAEKIGTLISTSTHAASKPAVARPIVSALKSAVAAATHDNPTLPQGSNAVSARSGEPSHRHSDSQKQEDDPAQLNQGAAIEGKTLVDERPSDPVPSAAASAKDGMGSTLSNAGSQAPAVAKSGTPPSPTGPAAPASAPQSDSAALALNRANIVAGMELSGLSKTSLIERFRQSELHFGMQSGEFGHIEVRTLLDHHELTARISVERGDLSRALESELPGLQKRLGDLDVPTARITLHEQSAAMSGDSGRRPKEQEWQAWQQQPAMSTLETHQTIPALLEPPMAPEGLSIRI